MQKVGPLKTIKVETSNLHKNDNSSGRSEPSVFVLFHGFGADAYDLQTLSEALGPSIKGPVTFYFPQGFLEVPIGPGWTGRAWWPIDWNRWEKAKQEQGPGDVDLSHLVPEGYNQARDKGLEFLAQIQKLHPGEKLTVGGFSQGAMLSTELASHLGAENLNLLLLLSGNLMNKADLKNRAHKFKDMKIFMSHGRQDPVLPFSGASRLESFLRDSQAQLKTYFFNGVHEIPPACIEALTKSLN